MTKKLVYTKNRSAAHADRSEAEAIMAKPKKIGKKRRESALESWCVKWARARKVLVSKLTDPTGIPDRCFWLHGGRPLVVEFKDPGGALTELQHWYQKAFSAAGYRVAVVYTKEQFLELVKDA